MESGREMHQFVKVSQFSILYHGTAVIMIIIMNNSLNFSIVLHFVKSN